VQSGAKNLGRAAAPQAEWTSTIGYAGGTGVPAVQGRQDGGSADEESRSLFAEPLGLETTAEPLAKELAMSEFQPALPIDPVLQRYREYARQRQMTLGDLLLENRIVFLGSSPETGGQAAITDYLANLTIQKLLYLQYENKTQEIHFYINCPGGSVTATLAIYDTMQYMECPIATYCMGIAASGAAIILAAGTKNKRYALPNSKVMIHQPWGQVGGQVSDMEIQATEIMKERHRLNEILAKHTGQSVDRIEKETDRDRYFTAQEAKEFGLVDEVIQKIVEEKKK
jgi:ATP-dependent Clp protease protease subunit